jgi:hypothetical protein
MTANTPEYVTDRGLRVSDPVEKLILLYGMPIYVVDENGVARPDFYSFERRPPLAHGKPTRSPAVIGG